MLWNNSITVLRSVIHRPRWDFVGEQFVNDGGALACFSDSQRQRFKQWTQWQLTLLSLSDQCLEWTQIYSSQSRLPVTTANYSVSQKKRHSFYISYSLARYHPILPILGRNILQEIWHKHKCTGHHVSFHTFVLYLVKSSNDFYGMQ